MLIGIDFDNTIVDYDEVFAAAAFAEGLLGPNVERSKPKIKAAILASEAGEDGWMRLQGRVYGAHMNQAKLFDGVEEFLISAYQLGVKIAIVSHKTELGHFDSDRINLHDAAWSWMSAHNFFGETGLRIDPDRVFFEETRNKKIARISSIGCDHFIDDLLDVLTDKGFPTETQAHHFIPGAEPDQTNSYRVHGSWADIFDLLLRDA